MQNQKTDSIDPVEDLPDIQDNHILFARLIAEGRSASDAYRQAISQDIDDPSVWALSSRLHSNAKVRLWIDAFKRAVFNMQAYTAEAHIQELNEAAQLCKANGNMGALVNALKAKGQVSGHYVEKVEIDDKREPELTELAQSLVNKHIQGVETKH